MIYTIIGAVCIALIIVAIGGLMCTDGEAHDNDDENDED